MTSTIVPSTFYSNNNNNNSNNTNSKSRRSTLQLSTIQEEVDTVVPDSTTTPQQQQQQQLLNKDMNDFHVGEDVLVKQKDGRYYLGTIVEVSCLIKECLVKFGDNTDRWAKFKTLTKLNTSEQDDLLLCVVCKKSSPKCQNDIIICDQCGRGYHQYCHHPKIAEEYQKEEAVWLCRRCLNVDPEKRNKSDWKLLKNRKSKSNHNKSNDVTVSTKTLPYDLTSLSWDTYHRVNNEHVYCYCGEGGEWYKQMLQCGRCRQWFHERCIDCLEYPLYCGDRFYVFVCSICNHGKEFLRRLEMKWVDLVHLMLFNLTAYNSRKYYDLDTTIIPYINDNWHALQLPPKISAVSKSERRENILSILTNNRNRFKCGREIKKRVTIWGLRVRLPPPAPTITLNFNGPITEEQLRERWQGNRRLQFLSNHNNNNYNNDDDDDDGDDDGDNNDEDDDEDDEIDENEDDDDDDEDDENDYELYNNKNKKLIPFDKHMKNVMMGVAYQHSNNQSETDSPCPSPEVEQQQQQQQDIYNNHNNDNLPPNTRGCAKKTATITERRKRLLTGRSLRKTKQRRNTNDGICGDTTIIDDTTRVYPTRLSLDNKNYQKNNQETTLPLTPPTSVSAPPTPPALSTTTSLLSDVSNDFGDSNSLDKQLNNNNNNNNNSNNHHNTPYDTSGDETSSKSTLDLIIPPPKDFEGKNNPFLTLLRSTNEQQKNKNKTNKKKDSNIVTSLPLPLTAVIPGKPIMRPTKRQLSEKDIFIGPNGEVKRKRLRRNRNNNNNNTYSTNNCGLITASKTATVLPVKPDAKEWAQLTTSNNINNTSNNNNNNSIDYSFNGRRLRQRPDKIQTDKDGNNSNNNGNNTKTNNNNNNNNNNNSSNNGTDMVDLKSSVNIYFGAANRIATGEKFTIKAKRIGPNGKLEFLIEWDGGSNGMT